MKDVWTGPLTSSAEKSLESIRPKNHCIYSNALFLLLRKKETLFLTRFAVLQRQALLAENQDGFILELTIALNTLKYLKKGLRMYEKRDFSEWLSTFRRSINGYEYYTDFKKCMKMRRG